MGLRDLFTLRKVTPAAVLLAACYWLIEVLITGNSFFESWWAWCFCALLIGIVIGQDVVAKDGWIRQRIRQIFDFCHFEEIKHEITDIDYGENFGGIQQSIRSSIEITFPSTVQVDLIRLTATRHSFPGKMTIGDGYKYQWAPIQNKKYPHGGVQHLILALIPLDKTGLGHCGDQPGQGTGLFSAGNSVHLLIEVIAGWKTQRKKIFFNLIRKKPGSTFSGEIDVSSHLLVYVEGEDPMKIHPRKPAPPDSFGPSISMLGF